MEKLSLFLFGLLLHISIYSQVIVNITSVPCNTGLEGTYQYTYAGELDGSSIDWACPNMYDVNNAISGPLEMINDSATGMVTGIGTPPLNNVPKSALGCDTLGNLSQDLSGKIAVIYRGTCNFSLKAYNAQKRGAIGVIIINHTGDPIPMTGGVLGVRVTIPVVMIDRVSGDDLFLALQNCSSGSIIGFIGSKIGFYNNDIGTDISSILMPENLTTPITLATNGVNFPVDLGLWAYNFGSNIQNGVTATVDVQFGGLSVYTQTSLPINYIAPIGNILDTQFIDLGTYAPAVWNAGVYSVTYMLNNADDDIIDNSVSYEFRISDMWGQGSYSKSRTDNSGDPIYNKMYSLSDFNDLTEWEVCINLNTKNNSFSFEEARFAVSTVIDNSTEMIDFRMYEWNDIFNDITIPPSFNNLNLLFNELYSLANISQSGNIVLTVPPPPVNSNQRYLFCLYSNSSNLRFGFDEEINYKATANHYQEPISPVRTMTTLGVNNWNFVGIGYGSIPSITLILRHVDIEPCNLPPFPCVGLEEEVPENLITPFPNPATNLLTVPIRKKVEGKVLIEVFDLTGKLVLSENNTIGDEALKINVASISNGAYMFKLTFANGTTDQYKISVNR